MQPIREPSLIEPRYAKDAYYAELHSKWAKRTAELLDPVGLKKGFRSQSVDEEGFEAAYTPAARRLPTVSPPTPAAGPPFQAEALSPIGVAARSQLEARVDQRRQQEIHNANAARTRPTAEFTPVSLPEWRDRGFPTAAAVTQGKGPNSNPPQSASSGGASTPPRQLHTSLSPLEAHTPILKMQIVQEKLNFISQHPGDLSTSQLMSILKDVESILQADGEGLAVQQDEVAPMPISPAPVQATQPPLPPAPAPEVPRRPPPTMRDEAIEVDLIPTSAVAPQPTPKPVEPSSTTWRNPQEILRESQLQDDGVQVGSPHISINDAVQTDPPSVNNPVPAMAAMTEFWQTYMFYAAAFQQYASSHSAPPAKPWNRTADAQSPNRAQAAARRPRSSGRQSTTQESDWSNQQPVDPRLKHRPQAISHSPTPRSGSGNSTPRVRRPVSIEARPAWQSNLNPSIAVQPRNTAPSPRERVMMLRQGGSGATHREEVAFDSWDDEESVTEVVLPKHPHVFVPHVPGEAADRSWVPPSHPHPLSSMQMPIGRDGKTIPLQDSEARIEARRRREQQERDQEKRAAILRRKKAEEWAAEIEGKKAARVKEPALTSETEKGYLTSRPKWH